ncbi:MAG TPA: AGE family epimerase/isomerase, partial [Petrimonas sp.]|nr:AGE family epimerase/isomerase [Petrimonas sp.]
KEELHELKDFYLGQLLNDTLPFWFPRCEDRKYGGYLLMRDRDGTLLDDDKSVWFVGRTVWTLAYLYNQVDKNETWLRLAKTGIDFCEKYCFDPTDGQMYFYVTRDGKPIRKRRYFFSETFAVIAYAAYAKATGDDYYAHRAREIFTTCLQYMSGERSLLPRYLDTRPQRGLGVPMIMINVAQQLRENVGDDRCDSCIATWIHDIEKYHVKHELEAVMEQVTPEGNIIDHMDGRIINPGHAVEAAWFILHEAVCQNNDSRLIELGCTILDYMWKLGWDKDHGGILFMRDVYNKPVQEYCQDMKFWWTHNEFIIATLYAYLLTGKEKYADMH